MAWKDKEAEKAYRKEWLRQNKEKFRAYQRDWHDRNRERINAQVRERRKLHPERERAAQKRFYWKHRERLLAASRASWQNDKRMHEGCRMRRKYGIGIEQFESLLAQQNNLCACCGQPERARGRTGKVKPLSVDHNHRTGQIRGLLCSYCNVGIGNLGDSIVTLHKAIAYLERTTPCL